MKDCYNLLNIKFLQEKGSALTDTQGTVMQAMKWYVYWN